MKTLKSLLTLFALLLLTMQLQAAKPVKQWGRLQVRGTQLCDSKGQPVVLRGVSFGWHNLWPRFYNRQAVQWLATDWHATVVRAAMGIQLDNSYLQNPQEAMKRITAVIEGAIESGIYVIVDWHAHQPHPREAAGFFAYIARKYGHHPNIIYELYNEPIEDSWESLKQYAGTVISAIRQYDPDNVILMGCPHWDQDIHLVAADPISGADNLMYTVHFYAATHQEQLRNRLTAAIESGIPVFVSECAGMEASGDGPLNPAQWQQWLDVLEAHKVSWVNWSISDKQETCSMLTPAAASTGHWQDAQLKESGRLVRQFLHRYNP